MTQQGEADKIDKEDLKRYSKLSLGIEWRLNVWELYYR